MIQSYSCDIIILLILIPFYRRQKVKKTAELRRNQLEDCRKYMLFLQDVMEAEAWIKDKQQIATDESFHDPVNLDSKKKKHSEFEAEVNANEQRIQNIAQVSFLKSAKQINYNYFCSLK